MQKLQWKTAWQVAATYIGTVVGAGFASGQEVLQFFTRFGDYALIGIVIAALLFFVLGDTVLRIGRKRGVHTFGEVADLLLGHAVSRITQAVLLLMLLGVTVAMVAGSGALFAEVFGLPFAVGALCCIVLTGIVLLGGMRGLLSVNSLIVPLMIGFITFAFGYSFFGAHAHPLHMALVNDQSPLLPFWRLILSAVLYVGFNIGLSLTVLVPLGHVPNGRKTLAMGALLGACGLLVLLILLHILLASFYGQLRLLEVPMVYIAKSLPTIFGYHLLRIGFIVVLWGEIFSTLIANVYGMACELSYLTKASYLTFVVLILTVAYAFCQIGFARIVEYTYPLFGYTGLCILALLLLSERRIIRL